MHDRENKMCRFKVLSITMLYALLCVLLLLSFGCNNDSQYVPSSNIVYTTKWEYNEFTELIVKPRHGTINYVEHFNNDKQYGIHIADISSEECNMYATELEKRGFRISASDSDEYSTAIMLENDKAVVSLRFSVRSMMIMITLK